MRRPVRVEAPRRLLELALAPRTVAAAGVQPGDGDVHEALEEVALGRRRLAPLVLELFVGLEVLARSDQLQSPLEPHRLIIGRTEC